MNQFRFDSYDVAELERCFEAFKERFSHLQTDKTGDFSEEELNWFIRSCAEGCRPYPWAAKKDEFLVDCCHTTYLDRADDEEWAKLDWWKRTLEQPTLVKLALESEWGHSKQPEKTTVMILDDASKLAAIRAEVKVMVFASQAGENRDEIVGLLEKLRSASADDAPWLLIDVPWELGGRPTGQPRNIEGKILTS